MYPPNLILSANGITLDEYAECSYRIKQKVDLAMYRIRKMPYPLNDVARSVYVAHSGGKDSTLVRWLVDNSIGPDYPSIHFPHPKHSPFETSELTKEFLYNLARPVLHMPSKLLATSKFAHLAVQIDGSRHSKSSRNQSIFMDNREVSISKTPLYLSNGKYDKSYVFPIYDWTDVEVWTAILVNKIPFSRDYYIPKE